MAPTPELFPGGAPERPWQPGADDKALAVEYEAGGAFAAVDGRGEITVHLDSTPQDPVAVPSPGLHELTAHERTERHSLEIRPSSGVRIHSLQFAAGIPG